MKRKGFIYTLEAVIAASLMLGTVIFVVPEVDQNAPPTSEDINSAMASLDQGGELEGNRSSIKDQLLPYAPSGYNLTIRTSTARSRFETVSDGDAFYLESGSKELMLWVDSASNLEVTYRGNTVFDRSQEGYHRVNLDSGSGYLNFTGSSDLSFAVQKYGSSGELPPASEAYSSNYIDYNGTLREIQVITWR